MGKPILVTNAKGEVLSIGTGFQADRVLAYLADLRQTAPNIRLNFDLVNTIVISSRGADAGTAYHASFLAERFSLAQTGKSIGTFPWLPAIAKCCLDNQLIEYQSGAVTVNKKHAGYETFQYALDAYVKAVCMVLVGGQSDLAIRMLEHAMILPNASWTGRQNAMVVQQVLPKLVLAQMIEQGVGLPQLIKYSNQWGENERKIWNVLFKAYQDFSTDDCLKRLVKLELKLFQHQPEPPSKLAATFGADVPELERVSAFDSAFPMQTEFAPRAGVPQRPIFTIMISLLIERLCGLSSLQQTSSAEGGAGAGAGGATRDPALLATQINALMICTMAWLQYCEDSLTVVANSPMMLLVGHLRHQSTLLDSGHPIVQVLRSCLARYVQLRSIEGRKVLPLQDISVGFLHSALIKMPGGLRLLEQFDLGVLFGRENLQEILNTGLANLIREIQHQESALQPHHQETLARLIVLGADPTVLSSGASILHRLSRTSSDDMSKRDQAGRILQIMRTAKDGLGHESWVEHRTIAQPKPLTRTQIRCKKGATNQLLGVLMETESIEHWPSMIQSCAKIAIDSSFTDAQGLDPIVMQLMNMRYLGGYFPDLIIGKRFKLLEAVCNQAYATPSDQMGSIENMFRDLGYTQDVSSPRIHYLRFLFEYPSISVEERLQVLNYVLRLDSNHWIDLSQWGGGEPTLKFPEVISAAERDDDTRAMALMMQYARMSNLAANQTWLAESHQGKTPWALVLNVTACALRDEMVRFMLQYGIPFPSNIQTLEAQLSQLDSAGMLNIIQAVKNQDAALFSSWVARSRLLSMSHILNDQGLFEALVERGFVYNLIELSFQNLVAVFARNQIRYPEAVARGLMALKSKNMVAKSIESLANTHRFPKRIYGYGIIALMLLVPVMTLASMNHLPGFILGSTFGKVGGALLLTAYLGLLAYAANRELQVWKSLLHILDGKQAGVRPTSLPVSHPVSSRRFGVTAAVAGAPRPCSNQSTRMSLSAFCSSRDILSL